MEEEAEALQRLLQNAAGAPAEQPPPIWPEVLAPYTDLLMSREPVLVWPSGGAGEIRMPALLWVVTLEGDGLFHADSLLRAVVALHRREGVAAPLEQEYQIRCSDGYANRTTPLNWVLYCRCLFCLGRTADISLDRLRLLLRMGANPNAPVDWMGGEWLDRAFGHTPLFAVLTRSTSVDVASLLLAFGARFDPVVDAGGLTHAMMARAVVPLMQLLRMHPEALQGVQHTMSPSLHDDNTPLHMLVSRRYMDIPGAVADARFLHETLGVSLLPRDTYGRTAADWAERRSAAEHTVIPQWLELSAYLRRAERVEALEAQRRMSVAAHHALASRLGSELTGHIGNALLPRDTFARFGREPPPPPPPP